MQLILHRLLMAATNADMRMEMNVEDEYFSIIEKRDTELLQAKQQLTEKTAQLEQKDDAQLEQQTAQLKSSVKMLMSAGLSVDSISATLGMSVDEVMLLAK